MSCVWSMAKSRWFAQIDLRSWFTVFDSTWKSRFLNFLLSRRPTSLPRCSLFTMPSPQKNKRKRRNVQETKRNTAASAPTRPRSWKATKTSKKGPHMYTGRKSKEMFTRWSHRDVCYHEARTNNPQNCSQWPRVPPSWSAREQKGSITLLQARTGLQDYRRTALISSSREQI